MTLRQKFQLRKRTLILGVCLIFCPALAGLSFYLTSSSFSPKPKVADFGGREIVFASNQDGQEIYAVNHDGTGLIQVTETPKRPRPGYINQFLRKLWPQLNENPYLGVYNDSPTWSPDKSKMAFISGEYFWDYDVVGGRGELYVVQANGSALQQLTEGLYVRDRPIWSPDGSRLAIRPAYRLTGIYVMDLPKYTTTLIAEDLQFDSNGPASWSPDSQKLLFSAWQDTKRDLFMINADGTGLMRLTDLNQAWAGYENPSWRPDGSKIAAVFCQDTDCNIVMMNPDGTNEEQLTADSDRLYEYLQWSSDGTQLLFQAWRGWDTGQEEIFIFNVARRELIRLTTFEGKDIQPKWSPDGRQVIFVSYRTHPPSLFIINNDGSGLTQLTSVSTTAPDW